MKKSNLITNTGHRFISRGPTAFKVHIHTPDDQVLHRSIGFLKVGEKKGLRKAIKLRNQLGSQLWGKHWKRILHEPEIFTRLPHSLEPKIINKPRPTVSDPDNVDACYLAAWREYDNKGNPTYKSVVCSINKHGKLAAYNRTKRALLAAYTDYIDILIFMGRVNTLRFD